MRLFIRLVDGEPVEHPLIDDNLVDAYPGIDLDNLPENFANFERVPKPVTGVYQVYEGATYVKFDNVYKDVHHFREMTPEEKQAKIDQAHTFKPYDSWIFNEEFCAFFPPSPYPEDGNKYIWNEQTTSWELV